MLRLVPELLDRCIVNLRSLVTTGHASGMLTSPENLAQVLDASRCLVTGSWFNAVA